MGRRTVGGVMLLAVSGLCFWAYFATGGKMPGQGASSAPQTPGAAGSGGNYPNGGGGPMPAG